MIAEYWKTWCPGFWNWPSDHHDLYVRMYCNNWVGGGGTAPWNFGPGFQSYASARGYSNFGTDWCVNRAYSVIQSEINSGRPMGVMFSYFDPVYDWHWCAIKGYSGEAEMVIINDPGGWVSYIWWPAHKATSVVTRIYRTS